MTDQVRPDAGPIRSLLFVPGHRERWVEPARASGADAIVFDLEDAVPVAEIDAARAVVRRAIDNQEPGSPRLLVRTGPPGTEAMVADLDAIVAPGLAGVMMPLVSRPDEVADMDRRLTELEEARGMAVGSTAITPLVETASAARFAYEIADASDRVAYMGGGTSRQGDVARSIGFQWTPGGDETLTLRSWVLLCVRAAGVPFPISGMWSVVDDLDGMRSFAEQTRRLGYSGCMVIHPSHVPVVNDVFTPSAAEVARWREVITVMRQAQDRGVGAIRHDGELIDEAHVKTAELGLALAERLGIATEG